MTLALALPQTDTFEAWFEKLQRLHLVWRLAQWKLGDWIIKGCSAPFGDQAFEAANRLFRSDDKRLDPVVKTCRRFPPDQRFERLRYEHHEATVTMGVGEDQARTMLAEANAAPRVPSLADFRGMIHVTMQQQGQLQDWADPDLEDKEYRAMVHAWNRCSLPSARELFRDMIADTEPTEEIAL